MPVGDRAKGVVQLQEQTTLLLNADCFKGDYLSAERNLDIIRHDIEKLCPGEPRLWSLPNQQRGRPDGQRPVWSVRAEELFNRALESALNARHAHQAEKPASSFLLKRWNPERIALFRRWLEHRESPHAGTLTGAQLAAADAASYPVRADLRFLLQRHDEYRRLVRDFSSVFQQLDDRQGLVPVQNQFYVLINRRYQPRYFWPTHVGPLGNESDEIWRGLRKRWFKAPSCHGEREFEELVGLDVSSSQTLILASFLGIESLERDASRHSFKELMAEIAWRWHLDPDNNFQLSEKPAGQKGRIPNYTGPDDQRLQRLCKTLWMRVCYGSTEHKVVQEQKEHQDTYGYGWTVENATSFGHLISAAGTS